MSFVLKVLLSSVLFLQISFGKTESLSYQTITYKKTASFLSEQPTYGDLLLNLAMAKMDPGILSIGKKLLEGKGLSVKEKIPEIQMNGNQISIKGLRYKIVVSNNYELELSYNDKKIPFNRSVDIEKNIIDIDAFFSKQEVSGFYQRLLVGEDAQAVGAIGIGLLLGTLFVISVIGWDMSRGKGTNFSEWFLSPDGLEKEIEFTCDGGNFTIVNGAERISFKSDKMLVDEKIAPDRKGYVYDMYTVTYYNRKKSSDGYQSISFFADDSEEYVREKFFGPPNYTPQKTKDLAELAKNVLGSDGKRKICSGNKFVNSATRTKFEELQNSVNKARKSKDKGLLDKVKQLDSGNQTK